MSSKGSRVRSRFKPQCVKEGRAELHVVHQHCGFSHNTTLYLSEVLMSSCQPFLHEHNEEDTFALLVGEIFSFITISELNAIQVNNTVAPRVFGSSLCYSRCTVVFQQTMGAVDQPGG